MSSIDLADFNAAVANANAAAGAPDGYNGGLGAIDMSKPVDYTGDWGKVMGDTGVISLRDQLAYAVWLSQGKPTAITVMTQDHLNKLVPRARSIIARSRIYRILSEARLPLTLRGSDVITIATVPNVARNPRYVDELYRMLTDGAANDAFIAEHASLILLELIANAMHRNLCDGHNWYTNDTANAKTVTGRLVAIAGRRKDEFKAHMKDHGHDGSHHLSDASLEAIADALTGVTPARVAVATNAAPPVALAPLVYMGENIRGQHVHTIFTVGDAAIDRWPPSELGKSAIIVALQFAGAMVDDMCSRVKVTGANSLVPNASALSSHFANNPMTRTDLRAMNALLGNLVAIVEGYCVSRGMIAPDEYKALESHAKRIPAGRAMGRSLASTVEDATPHSEAVESSVTSAINTIAAAIAAAAGYDLGEGAVGPLDIIAHDASAVVSEVGRSNADRMMDMMLRGNDRNQNVAAAQE